MSWLYSQALVEEFLGESSSDGEPSVQSNGNPTQLAYLPPDRMTAFSRLSRFGMTFKPLTEDRGEALLMSYLEGFPAKTSQQPEKAQESKVSEAECGNTWRGWLAKYDPDSSSWRTAQCSFIEDFPESLETLPRSGMTRGGLLWELPMLERHTSGIGFGLWPTPTTQDNVQIRGVGKAASKPTRGTTLGGAVRMWPTPTVNDSKNLGRGSQLKRNDPGLNTIVRLWPTPNSGSTHWGGTMQEWGGSQNWVRKEMPELASGALNPTWVEWLMGWPLGWTDLKPLEMDRYHYVRQQLGEFSQEICDGNN